VATLTPTDVTRTRVVPRWRGLGWIQDSQISHQLAFAALALVLLLAVFGPLFDPHNPLLSVSQPYQSPNGSFPFGTDDAGRDMLSRCLSGIRITLLYGVAIVAVGLLIGGAVGLIAGAVGGWLDAVLMRTTDLFLALPAAVLSIAVVAAIGPSLFHTFLAISIFWWPYYARLIRVEVKALAARPYNEAAKLAGVSRRRRLLRHLLPGAIPTAIVAVSLDLGAAVILLATLSFLGLGAQPPTPELGSMTASGLADLQTAWWISAIPALLMFVVILVANMAGDAVRDLVDR
jgi:peptide/nickel transport system permease protein